MDWLAENLPHATASLNALATILLLLALWQVKRGNIKAHRNLMLTALSVSVLFLGLYLLHKFALLETTGSPNKKFPRDPAVASQGAFIVYLLVLLTHIPLAITVPVLAVWAAILGLKDRRSAHRRLVRWAFPIWLYVSISGVVVYLMLYQIYVPPQ
ncbi:hypothetical protein FF011L_49620 [Roseimaritima multifibrata]|uniref:DUF420 domain-containing protein n=1 Tax=Roseimaritima multifibrata TaxID=1930274 RepID=A0A517MMQ6_9BACT|nr:DUF420 domain-containing protein [Roseimaritima multifibrata]QDS96154.1 hypothetical protein FF011L_49620 [Roseimaritima multifibrata]